MNEELKKFNKLVIADLGDKILHVMGGPVDMYEDKIYAAKSRKLEIIITDDNYEKYVKSIADEFRRHIEDKIIFYQLYLAGERFIARYAEYNEGKVSS